ncbi:conserved hypothetical protein [Bathymodiolus platifrons methanotrophic gill symbiont]|uniref:aspartate carbamoyltransferase n=1 Tax=Bathymodiolus platifrons methanotrophic gill symbiont TaxID=113268 RepID=UPI000B6C7D78|nr:aspartate carbamoyltransferase [Bathymodiolus platifrons methanotrophic gill symbiont]MCK5869481.1 aspartate carbamoyltransferase [Methyloprofundus sp.]GAW85314.1 conserved hypothetical protein [Bathymodiolus platifrons methanotrophic gill symbiont]GFO73923.1 hypothetical protein BPLS_P0264 [Bathymodiolus platifrons methanotrophic gill symbiont]
MTTDKLIFSFLAGMYFMMPATALEKAPDARINEVAQLGKQVMPFDLNQTLHIFSKVENGGVQQVIAKDPKNEQQIKLIREHLDKIASDFKQANFSDPEKIHGKDMPGLEAMRSAEPGKITIKYREIPEGAEITYMTASPNLVTAIHQWFNAQLRDHGRHAAMHRMHHQ